VFGTAFKVGAERDMPSNPKANDSSQSHSSHSPYRDLDQSKNEIRFLRILP
jgi:hypothetical protein